MKKILLILAFSHYFCGLLSQSNIVYVYNTTDNVLTPSLNSLRWAINQVNTYNGPGYSEIRFNIPSMPPHTITMNSTYPIIQKQVLIDGNTQPLNGYAGTDKRISITTSYGPINGWHVPALQLGSGSDNSTVRNLSFINCSSRQGLRLMNNSGVIVENNVFKSIYNPTVSGLMAELILDGGANHIVRNNVIGDPLVGTIVTMESVEAYYGTGGHLIGGLGPNEPNFFYNCNSYGVWLLICGNSNKVSGNLFINTNGSMGTQNGNPVIGNIYLSSPGNGWCSNICKLAPVVTLNQVGQTTNISGTAVANDFVELYLSNATGVDALQLLATTTANNLGQFSFTLNGYTTPGTMFTMLATDVNNNTSGFVSVGLPPLCCANSNFITNTGLQNIVNVSPGVYSANACNSISFNAGACAPIAQSYAWDFGDGPGTVSGANVSHQYATAGTYAVTALISGAACVPTTQLFNVNVSCCNTAITGAGSGGCVNSPVTFGTDCTNPLATYNWNFGDGNTATGMPASHAYSSSGNYNVSLTIINPPSAPVTINTSISITQCPTINNCKDCIGSFSPEAGQYLLSLWVREENHPAPVKTYPNTGARISFIGSSNIYGPFFPNLAKNKIIDGWQRIEEKFTVPPGATSVKIELINNNTAVSTIDSYYDDIRILPLNGNMRSYVYDPISLRLSAELDENNYATFFEYDEEGKLIRVKKETERGVMTVKESRTSMKKQ